jgi:hypothetical protein
MHRALKHSHNIPPVTILIFLSKLSKLNFSTYKYISLGYVAMKTTRSEKYRHYVLCDSN